MLWEKIFLNTMKELKVEHETDDFKMYFFAGRRYDSYMFDLFRFMYAGIYSHTQ